MIRLALKVLVLLVAGCGFLLCAMAGGAPALATDDPSALATGSIPPGLLVLFQQASAASTCGVPWTLLAAVAKTESSFDASGVSDVGAQGLFQFEPATFSAYATPTPPGGATPPTPFDPTDAAYAAARYLCALGVAANPSLALVAYNCGNTTASCQAASAGYAQEVLATAAGYTAPGGGTASAGVPSAVQAAVVSAAESQIGTPYVYGGASPKTGFDCSGLVLWAYGLAGVVVPRVANDQWHDEPHVGLNELVPGNLIFFGTGAGSSDSYAEHVGIYIGNSAMVDAPHTGADVRIDTIPLVVGADWGGGEVVLGAADPVAS